MDLFKFNNPNNPTKMEQGQFITGLKSKMWIERYDEAGEFTLVANASAGMREQLPIGSFISHVESPEIMIIENHEINDERGKDVEITVTGRGFETYLENRIVGSNRTFPTSGVSTEYVLPADLPWNQVVHLIEQHILASALLDDGNVIPFVSVLASVAGTDESIDRSLRQGPLYSSLLELIKATGLGIKVIRPGLWSPLGGSNPNTAIIIHKGTDKSNEVVFSYDTGEISSADYLWSNKKLKNAAMITGKWIQTVLIPFEEGYDRRMTHIDASFIDDHFTEAPIGTDLDNVIISMQRYAYAVISSQKNVALTKAQVSKDINKVGYRTDFNVGDIIKVSGDYSETSNMRISEYVEIEDRTGTYGYPTLTPVT